jgi:hypothetical protein
MIENEENNVDVFSLKNHSYIKELSLQNNRLWKSFCYGRSLIISPKFTPICYIYDIQKLIPKGIMNTDNVHSFHVLEH